MTDKIIDISVWQGKISVDNFKKVKVDGISGVILRTSYTSQKSFSLNADSVFVNNIKNAIKADLKVGAYHYSQAISVSEAQKEAKYMLNILAPYKEHLGLPVWCDWEFGGRLSASKANKLGKTKCTEIVNAFCEICKTNGYKTGVYANLSTLNGYLTPSAIDNKYYVWCAQYSSKLSYKRPCYMWQYTSSGRVNGISGRIDMNYLYENVKPDGKISVDGEWGCDTTRRLQQFLACKYNDGIISSQPKSQKKYVSAGLASTWKFVTNAKGSQTIKDLQTYLKVEATGKINQATIKALQNKVGVVDDGYCGSKTVKALQEWLNSIKV